MSGGESGDYGRMPDSMSFDNGYFSGPNLEALSKYGVNAFVAVGREKRPEIDKREGEGKLFDKSVFTYVEAEDVFICPNKTKLTLKSKNKDETKIYSGIEEECLNCKFRSSCCKSKKGQPRTVSTDDYESLRNDMREKMKQSSSKEIYARRKVIVEPVFGQIKNQGFRDIHLRGFEKVKGEFALVCSSHNLKKLVRHLRNVNFSSSALNDKAICGILVKQSMSRTLQVVCRCKISLIENLNQTLFAGFFCLGRCVEENSYLGQPPSTSGEVPTFDYRRDWLSSA